MTFFPSKYDNFCNFCQFVFSFVPFKLVFLLSPECENLPKTSLEACKELLHLDEIQALNGSLKLSLDPGCVVIWIYKEPPWFCFLKYIFQSQRTAGLCSPENQNQRTTYWEPVPVSWNLKALKEPMTLVLWKIRIKESPVPVIWNPLKNWWFQFLSILESENHWIQFSEKNQSQRTIDLRSKWCLGVVVWFFQICCEPWLYIRTSSLIF